MQQGFGKFSSIISTSVTIWPVPHLLMYDFSGLGLMMYLVCASVAVTTSFEKRRTLALGIGVTGLGFGLLVWSPLIRFLLNLYGRRGTLLLFR